jgi:hypothetical protein
MEGDLSLVSVPDLLQMICLGGYNRDIHLFDGPTQLGVIAIRNGHIDRCFGFGMWGEAAFFKLVLVRRGRYKVNDAQDMSASDATLTAYSWQELLMEAVRLQDEAEHVAQSAAVGTGRVIAFPSPDSYAVTFEALPATASGATWGTMAAVGDDWLDTAPDTLPANAPAALSATPATPATPDITALLEEATSCYLRRDLARAEAVLQQCLVLRPGDKHALQNLERIRRKKTP